jgi:hypothetical protein
MIKDEESAVGPPPLDGSDRTHLANSALRRLVMNMNVILLKVLTGVSLGVAAGVLMAPQRGAETRRQLGEGQPG